MPEEEEEEHQANGHQEEDDREKDHANESFRTGKQFDDDDEGDKGDNPDGVRRSQRTRKFIYQSYNDSWIFGERTAKVCILCVWKNC